MRILRDGGRLGSAALLASVLIASAGRASVPEGSAVLSSDSGPLQGRRCPKASVPEQLPDLATVVDLEGLQRALAAELADSVPAGDMLFSIRFAREGQREWLERIRGESADVPRDLRVQRVIAEHLRIQPPARAPWSLRLQVIPGDSIQLRISHSEVCPVELIAERPAAAGAGFELMNREELEGLRRAGPVVVGVDVSATGRVLGVDLVQRSGSRVVDDQALRTARESRYRPAVVDGMPVAGRYEYRSRTRVRTRVRTRSG